MSQVRDVIELLTKILKSNGTSKIKAEIFRLAKFDKNDAVEPLWRLLFELLYFLEYGSLDEVVTRALTELTAEEQVVYVKQGVQKRGYLSAQFAALPSDQSEGSRELLLALAWFLSTENVVDKFMENCSSPLDTDLADSPREQRLEAWNVDRGLTSVQKIQQLQLLNGKLRMNLKNLYALHRERAKLQHKVHESTQGVSSGNPDREHLSVLEIQLLRHPSYLKRVIQLLEKDSHRLQQMLQWKNQEDVFWKWMESVLDLKRQDLEQVSPTSNTSGPMVHYNIPPDLLSTLSKRRRQVEAAILKYEPIIVQLEELWELKHESISRADLDSLLAAIDLELAIHEDKLSETSHRRTKHVEPQFVYSKSSNKKSVNTRNPDRLNINTTEAASWPEQGNLQDEITKLQSHLHKLELEARRKEDSYKQKLDKLATQIPEAVCIQPASLM